MTTSHAPLLSEIQNWSPIPQEKLVYFRVRLKQRLYSFLLAKFAELEQKRNLTKAGLARRIGRDPALITRWLGNPGNLELDTVSDLLLGMKRELLFTDREIDETVVTREMELWVSNILNAVWQQDTQSADEADAHNPYLALVPKPEINPIEQKLGRREEQSNVEQLREALAVAA